MIIGINGYIGSGKDTVAKIIQDLDAYEDDRNDMGAGTILRTVRGWEVRKWAEKLKQIASLITGIPRENFEDQEFKKTEMGAMWGMSVREFLQRLGTEAMRNGLHRNVWVNALMSDYKRGKNGYPNWLVSDTRYPNEAQAIIDTGGIIIRVDRFQKEHTLVGLHPTEIALDDWDFDARIKNDGSIEDLIPKVKEVLKRFNLLSKVNEVILDK